MKVWNVGAVKQGGTRQADRPASMVRWGREASTDHSHEDGERAVDAVLVTLQDPQPTRHRRVPRPPGRSSAQRSTRGDDPEEDLTMFSQDPEVGVKCRTILGLRAS